MIKVDNFTDCLLKEDFNFMTGVPCSILKDFLNYVDTIGKFKHIIASCESEAVGIAAGYYLVTQGVPIVYMQNSGLGNSVDPLTSLTNQEVYNIPMLLLVSWRGEPGTKDVVQHLKMGNIMMDLLSLLDIEYEIASDTMNDLAEQILKLKRLSLQAKKPVALVVRKELFEIASVDTVENKGHFNKLLRETVLEILLRKFDNNIVVSTTGKTSREVFDIREKNDSGHHRDFLVLGSMGCASSISLGIAIKTKKKVFILDGDGALLMHMGTIATIGHHCPENIIHIVIDNCSHESTGGQRTVSETLDWNGLFMSVGYKGSVVIESKEEIEMIDFNKINGPYAIVIKTIPGSRKDLIRPTLSTDEMKDAFTIFLKQNKK